MANSVISSMNTLEFGNSHNQLVTKKRRIWGKIAIIFAAVSALLLGCIFIWFVFQDVHQLPEPQSQKETSVTLSKIINGTFEPHFFNGTWVSGNEILMKNSQGYLVLFNVVNKTSKILLQDRSVLDIAAATELSADKKYLMIAYDFQKIYRHSSYAHYLIYDIEKHTKKLITNSRGELLPIQSVKWSPRGNAFIYIYLYNIYYKPSAESDKEYQITSNGNSTLYNGICDWVYEEEIFSDTNAFWFSPDGEKLAFASFNDLFIDVMSIPYYGEPGTIESQYPAMIPIRYPKPGRINPTVKFSIVDLKETETEGIVPTVQEIPLPTDNEDTILSAVKWITNIEVAAIIMNRVQNKGIILSCKKGRVPCSQIMSLENKKGWLDLYTPPLFSSNGERMLMILPEDQGNNAGAFRHLIMLDILTKNKTALTRGKYTVTEIVAWDETNEIIYYLATEKNFPMNQKLYKINERDNIEPECLTCIIDKSCAHVSVSFNKENSLFVQTCNGPSIPEVSIFDTNNNEIFIWENNAKLKSLLENVTLPEVQFHKYSVAQDMEAYVKLLLPPNMDKSGKTKYPLLINVYGGPNSNLVYNKFKVSWETYFNVNNDAVIAYIDGRGSGLKGDNMLFANYRRLGSAEVQDQINVTREIQMNFPFIDSKRTGIWGWSYGGYVTGMALASDSRDVFKCGVSVAPVTDWLYYDSMYTERFMGLPTDTDNKAGYISSSLLKKSVKLANKLFLLIHGTLDDNVHYQQSMMLSRVLELNDIMFRQQTYPDEVHSLSGVRRHFYHTLEMFFLQCFT